MPVRSAKVKWLLLADIHFKHHDLSRIMQTAAWINSVAKQQQVHRVVVCGDLLTCRSSQPTHVLSACYRFLSSLVHDAQVAHVHVVTGNHDLAYRRDYATTALEALCLATPLVQLHRDVGSHVWDGRRVLILPFREDQSELTDAVAALGRDDAVETVAFAHLAIHKAITQRHVVHPSPDATNHSNGSIAYHGLISPTCFSSLARTYTGHFHCHQTILQPSPIPNARELPDEAETARLHGSVTYVGSPLQLTWADFWDKQRGVILLDPKTLRHELIVNPYAVGYITADLAEVLGGTADPAAIRGRHVMLLGDLTSFKYAAARDKLVSLGARSVRSWRLIAPRFQGTVALHGLGITRPASDSLPQQATHEIDNRMNQVAADEPASAPSATDLALAPCPSQPRQVDIREQVARYVEGLDLEKSLEKSRKLLIQVGQKLLEAATSEQADASSQALGHGPPQTLTYKGIIPRHRTDEAGTTAQTHVESPTIFSAQPRSLTITNFLSIQSRVHFDFGTDITRGLTFLVGANGSGKSTLVEAIVWCQFGRCLRSGLSVNDVVNEKTMRDCSVRIEFNNGYAIERFRKHKAYGNRIIVEHNGKVLPEFEKADARSTQATIDELLGVNYDVFIRTIVLGHESATSFLSSTPAQKRALILSILGLEVLDYCTSITRRLLRELDGDMAELQSKLVGLEQRIDHVHEHIMELDDTKRWLEEELKQTDIQREEALKDLGITTGLDTTDATAQLMQLDEQISAAQKQVVALLHCNKLADARRAFEKVRAAIHDRRLAVIQDLRDLECRHLKLLSTKPVEEAGPIAEPERNAASPFPWLLDILVRMHDRFQSMGVDLKSPLLSKSLPSTPWQRVAGYSLRAVLMLLRRITAMFGKATGVDARKKAKDRMEQELHAYRLSLEGIEGMIAEQQRQLSRLEHLGSKSRTTQRFASEEHIPKHNVRDSLLEVSTADAKAMRTHLNSAFKMLAHLQGQRELHLAKRANLGELQAATRAISAKVATYGQIVERESVARRSLEANCDIIRNNMASLAADRTLIDFWASALAQKSRRSPTSTSSSSSSSATSSYNFREFMLEQSLSDLNTFTTQILPILFENSRHATALTTGMLRSLFIDHLKSTNETEGEKIQDTSAAALDS